MAGESPARPAARRHLEEAVAKLKAGHTGDSLCDEKIHTYYPMLRSFESAISFALEAKNKGEEDKATIPRECERAAGGGHLSSVVNGGDELDESPRFPFGGTGNFHLKCGGACCW